MNLIDDYSFRILKKLGFSSESTFTGLSKCIKNKKTRSDRLKFLLKKKVILNKGGKYELTKNGKMVLKYLKMVKDILNGEKIQENFDMLPYIFRDYLYNLVFLLKESFKENLLSIILFGSVARGKWTKESDIDLFIIFSNEASEKIQKLSELIIEFYKDNKIIDEKGTSIYAPIQEFSLFIKDLNTFRTLFYDIAMDGIIVFDKNQTGKKFLDKIKLRIKNKGLKRIYIDHNDFYWKRKEIKFGEIIEL